MGGAGFGRDAESRSAEPSLTRWLVALFGAFAGFWSAPPAVAEPAQGAEAEAPEPAVEPPQPAPIVPPRLLSDAEVAYPEAGEGDARVLLELLIGEDGSVREARVVSGEPPFASAARAAALDWRFVPARQGGVDRAARIRFELSFAAPPPEPPEPPEQALAPETPASAPAEPPPAVVNVRGRVKPVDSKTLTRAEVRQLPGAFGDPFRAIEALPGVTPIASGVPFFYVRGAPPGNVGYFLDGIRVPLLYHVGLGPSVVHPGLVESVDLYPGAYPARYGRFGGGIVAGLTGEPRERFSGEWQVRIFDAGALFEVPFAEGRGHLTFGGRYSYTAAVIALFAEDVRLEYWDYQLRADYRLSESDTLAIFGFGSFDYFGEDTADDNDEFLATEFHRLDLRHARRLSDDASLHTALTFGYDQTYVEEDAGVASPNLSARTRYERRFSERLSLEAGASLMLDDYGVETRRDDEPLAAPSQPDRTFSPPTFDPSGPGAGSTGDLQRAREQAIAEQRREQELDDEEEFERSFPSRTDVAVGAYVEARWEPLPGVEVTPGLRLDVFFSDGASALSLDPRLSAAFRVGQHWTLTHTLGLAHQPPSFVIPVPGLQMGGLRGGLQRSVQSSAGVVRDLPDGMSVSATLFHNQFFGLSDLLSLVRNVDDDELSVDARTRGRSYGLELLFRRSLSRKLGGFLSYTLSRSERFTPGGRILSAFDRPHVLSAALGYDLGRAWRAGGRFSYYSGTPVGTLAEQSIGFTPRPPPTSLPGEGVEPTVVSVERASHPARLPAFHRFDVRLEKRFPIGHGGASWSFVFEVQNVTLNREVLARSCWIEDRFDAQGQVSVIEHCENERIGPVTIPSIGVEGRF